MADGHAVNIPQPGNGECPRGRRSETCARRRNGALKGGSRKEDGGNVLGEPRQYTRPTGRVTATEEQTPEKNRWVRLIRYRPVP